MTFRMNKSISKNLTKRKRKINKRLRERNWEGQPLPMLKERPPRKTAKKCRHTPDFSKIVQTIELQPIA
jgi:hypothetical protein